MVPERTDVVLSVTQHTSLEPQVIGFTGYDLNDDEELEDNVSNLDIDKAFFKTRRSMLNSQYTNSRQVRK